MKIYSNHLTEADVRHAFTMARIKNGADISIEEIRTWTPRHYKVETPKHTNYAYGVEVWAESLYGKQATGHRPIGSYSLDDVPRAASWDDWGYVIAHLFNVDPSARIGFYDNEADFVAKVRKYPRKGSSLAFLGVLDTIKEYGEGDPQCMICGTPLDRNGVDEGYVHLDDGHENHVPVMA